MSPLVVATLVALAFWVGSEVGRRVLLRDVRRHLGLSAADLRRSRRGR